MALAVNRSVDSALELADQLAPQIATLPRLSQVVEAFLENAGRDTARAEDFAAALSLDPTLEGWVLRQTCSGYFNLATPPRTVSDACVVLGLEPLSRLVYAACTQDLLEYRMTCYRYPGHGFWLHGLAVGVAARKLAIRLGPQSPLGAEEAFVAGLLHDVGKILLDPLLPRTGGPRHITIQEEMANGGRDHALISAAVTAAWSMPFSVIEAVAQHHEQIPSAGGRLVAAADLVIRHWGVGIWTYAKLDIDPPLTELGCLIGESDVLESWCAELPPILAGLEEMLLSMNRGTLPDLPGGSVGTRTTSTKQVKRRVRTERPPRPSIRRRKKKR